ncbi:MAG: acyl-CoA dehydrogenase family protein, partial [Dehalococcoidales bacterium]|nr:acyl-CoA dehydrogenase family protein [Dehalococcoidales bacterium]
MDFSLTEEQEMLKTMAHDFLEKECPEAVVRKIETDEKGYSPELWRKIAELGWLGLTYPEEYGGTGGNLIDLMVIHEEIGRALFPSPHLSTVVLCGHTILEAGSEAQKKEFLPKIVNGELILAMALSEPESSWDGK